MHYLIYDHTAAGQKFERAKAVIETALTDAGVSHKSVNLSLLNNISSLVATGLSRGAHTLIAIGNDTLMHAVINSLNGHRDIVLGFIPFGEGPHRIAEMLGIPYELPSAAQTIISRILTPLDLGCVFASDASFSSSLPSSSPHNRAPFFSRSPKIITNDLRSIFFLLGVECAKGAAALSIEFAPGFRLTPDAHQLIGFYNYNYHSPNFPKYSRPDDSLLDALIVPRRASGFGRIPFSEKYAWEHETRIPCKEAIIQSLSPHYFSIDGVRDITTPFSVALAPYQLRCISGSPRRF